MKIKNIEIDETEILEMSLEDRIDLLRAISDSLEVDVEMRECGEIETSDKQRQLALKCSRLGRELEIVIREYDEESVLLDD